MQCRILIRKILIRKIFLETAQPQFASPCQPLKTNQIFKPRITSLPALFLALCTLGSITLILSRSVVHPQGLDNTDPGNFVSLVSLLFYLQLTSSTPFLLPVCLSHHSLQMIQVLILQNKSSYMIPFSYDTSLFISTYTIDIIVNEALHCLVHEPAQLHFLSLSFLNCEFFRFQKNKTLRKYVHTMYCTSMS